VDRLVTLRFDRKMLAKQPDEFVREYLVENLGTKHVIVGHDYRYGTRASGTSDTLLEAGAKYGFSVEKVRSVDVAGVVASNASIRKNLLAGEFEEASHLLGRAYRMRGRVVHGQALGRTLGYPTANLRLMRQKSPVWGISAVRVYGIEAHAMEAVASIGTRPTVNGVEPLLEVHIFDFNGDLYGKTIEVEFVAKLREELKFDSLDALVVQMDRDSARAREILKEFRGFTQKLDFGPTAGESEASSRMARTVDG
jgi:riboflavin kinase/FMN adenylyltransferase